MLPFTHQYQLLGDTVVISLFGSLLNEQPKQEVLDTVQSYLSIGKIMFIIDCQALTAINSMGLTLLLNILTKVRNEDGEVVLVNIPTTLQKVLVITKLNSIFDIQATLEAALEKYGMVKS